MTDQTEREKFKAAHRHLDLTEGKDAWGRPKFKHSHVDAMHSGWQARAALDGGAVSSAEMREINALLAGPCPICKGIEGCDHTRPERLAALRTPPQQQQGSERDLALIEYVRIRMHRAISDNVDSPSNPAMLAAFLASRQEKKE